LILKKLFKKGENKMPNHNNTLFECSNPKVVKSFVEVVKVIDTDHCKDWKDGDTKISVGTYRTVPRKDFHEVLQLGVDWNQS
jgi:hypothetical protein